ncbi:ficolin-2-like [Mytilus edulis]|uniref:ficolin-2-like n=1 Tax=Mytilus edulis TaxID=6550 RepID=UPI0039EF921B
MDVPLFLLLIYAFANNMILCDNEVRMRIHGSITATGTMENITEDSRKTVKLATEIRNMLNGTMENLTEDSNKAVKLATGIKDMLNGMCLYSDSKNSCEKMEKETQKVTAEMDSIKDKLDKILSIVTDMKNNGNRILPKECKYITDPGLQTIYLDDLRNMSVQCEEGGWTLIQKRYDGSVEFHRNWKDYENGFGDIHGEFWLGNKNIAQLTSEGNHELRIDVEDWDGNMRYAVYKSFSVGDSSTKYRLNISNYSGNAGDGMSYYNGMKFSTYDQDNDEHKSHNCAGGLNFQGGWWYNNCWHSLKDAMLNGHYTHRNDPYLGIMYRTVGKYSMKKSTMKIRRL